MKVDERERAVVKALVAVARRGQLARDVKVFKAGYIVVMAMLPRAEGGSVMRSAFNLNGDYIGTPKDARFLCAKLGIQPELAARNNGKVCSVGFCEGAQKWYGWSHRARRGFGVGDTVTSADHMCAQSGWTDEYLAEHPEVDRRLPVGFKAESLSDCRRMAVAFADAVG